MKKKYLSLDLSLIVYSKKTMSYFLLLSGLMTSQMLLATEENNQIKNTTKQKKSVQKYNGYGLPNTKFKKIKIDLTKKEKPDKDGMTINMIPKNTALTKPDFMKESDQNENLINSQLNHSEPINQQTIQIKQSDFEKIFYKFGFKLNSSYNTQAEKQTDNSKAEYLYHELIPSFKVYDYTLYGYFYYYDDIISPSYNEWNDSYLAMTRTSFNLGNYLTLTPATTLTFPLSKKSRDVINIKYSLGGSASLALNTAHLNIPQLSLSYSLSYTKMINEYNTDVNGNPISSYRIRQRFNFGYQILEKLAFKTRFQFDASTSYENVTRNSFLHYQFLEYQFHPNLSVNIGHTNTANAFKIKNGEQDYYLENNIKFYSPETSEFSIGLGMSI